MSAGRHQGRTLARRYWDALIDSRPYEPGGVPVRRDLSLWQRYWISLLGLPPPAPKPLPAAEPVFAPRADEPAAAPPRERATWTLSLGRALLPVAMTAALVAAGVLAFRPLMTQEPISAGPATPPAATTDVQLTQSTQAPAEQPLYDDIVSLPRPAARSAMALWRLTPDGPVTAEPGDADLVLSRDAVYVDENRTLVVTSREQCRSSPPTEGVTVGERRARPHQRLCILTHASDLAYVIFADPDGRTVDAAITLWPAG